VGKTHKADRQAKEMEKTIEKLIGQSASQEDAQE